MDKYSLFIGRYQPLHEGHIKLIRTVLKEGKKVLIALRDTGTNEKNPYSILERRMMFSKAFSGEIFRGDLRVIVLPDIEEVVCGRGVGWGYRQIQLDAKTESISATEIRKKKKNGK